MNILDKILKLRIERNWTEYRLSMESGIPQSTISSWYRKKISPSLSSIEAVCKAFDISVSFLFADDKDKTIELTDEQKKLLDSFAHLSAQQKQKLIEFVSVL